LRIVRLVQQWLNDFVNRPSVRWYYSAFPVLGQSITELKPAIHSLYGLPLAVKSLALYYRTDLLPTPPALPELSRRGLLLVLNTERVVEESSGD
jgi:hypothetical protein